MSNQSIKAVLAIHGGAGTVLRSQITPEKEKAYQEALRNVLEQGQIALAQGASSLDVVAEAVRMLEDCPLFNAGKGAVFNSEEEHELDASIMEGSTLQAGAVALVRHVKNPILAARAVLDTKQYVCFSGPAADAFAREHGLEMVEQSYYSTSERREQLHQVQKQGGMRLVLDHDAANILSSGAPLDERTKMGTVGAVACDIHGNVAAANSTGGMTNKMPGRVGDSAVIGAGCYADNRTAAVATTGTGETFIRGVVAYDICALMHYQGLSVSEAAEMVIMNKQPLLNGQGGLVAVDRYGNVSLPFNTDGMYRGYAYVDQPVVTAIYREGDLI